MPRQITNATDHYGNTIRVGDYAQLMYDERNRLIAPDKRTAYRVDAILPSGSSGSRLQTFRAEYAFDRNPTGSTLIGRSRRCEKVEAPK